MKCTATIKFGDDYGDNSSTFHCQLEEGHEGQHQEIGDMGWEKYKMPYNLMWDGNDSELELTYDQEADQGDFSEDCLPEG